MPPHDPNILAAMTDYFSGGGESATGGGDKEKDKKAAPAKIPLPNYDDPKSRLAYATAIKEKYKLPAGYGDTFLRINETPDTRTDSLNTRQLIAKTAPASGLPPSLFHTSAMVEGMSGLYPYGKNNDVDFSGDEKYPVSGFKNFGLDTFAGAYPSLVKKGYLPAEFQKQFSPTTQVNEQKQKVSSANFTTAEAALQAKAAMLRDAGDQVTSYATTNKIPLSDKAKHFFTLAYYNGGPGAAKGMLQEYLKSGALKDDSFFTNKPAQSKYGQVYNNVMQRFQLANAADAEGYTFDDKK